MKGFRSLASDMKPCYMCAQGKSMVLRFWSALLLLICSLNAFGGVHASLDRTEVSHEDPSSVTQIQSSQQSENAQSSRFVDSATPAHDDDHDSMPLSDGCTDHPYGFHQCHLGHCSFLVSEQSLYSYFPAVKVGCTSFSLFGASADRSGPIKPPQS